MQGRSRKVKAPGSMKSSIFKDIIWQSQSRKSLLTGKTVGWHYYRLLHEKIHIIWYKRIVGRPEISSCLSAFLILLGLWIRGKGKYPNWYPISRDDVGVVSKPDSHHKCTKHHISLPFVYACLKDA